MPASSASALAATLALVLLGGIARAEVAGKGAPEVVGAAERSDRELEPGPLPALIALGPGLVVSGAGHYLAGDRTTAQKLLLLQGAGLAVGASAGLLIYLTRASRRLPGATYQLVVSGVGLFAISWLADLYGAAGGARAGASPRLALPLLELEVGYARVVDPHVVAADFAVVAAEVTHAGLFARPSLHEALRGDNRRARLELAYRLRGPGAGPVRALPRDASFVEVGAAATHHRFGDERFATATGELFALGRLDMRRLSPTLAGSFAELGGGIGLSRIRYHVEGAGADWFDLLLARFGYGMLLGRPGAIHGEVSVYYDHRRDDFAGGLSPGRNNGSGFLGHFGAGGFLDLPRRFGLSARLEIGAALVAQIGFRYRFAEEGP